MFSMFILDVCVIYALNFPCFRNFVNLISDDSETELDMKSGSPIAPPVSPLTPVDEW